jgi:hypothetical protein
MAEMRTFLNRLRGGGDHRVSSPRLRANLPSAAASSQAVYSLDLSESQRAALEGLFAERNQQRGVVSNYRSVADLEGKNFPVPDVVWRAHMGQGSLDTGLQRAAGAATAPDDYLAAIVRHTARTGGSEGQVLSLSAKEGVAERFSRDGTVPRHRIHTIHAPEAFRTAADILAKDGPRLVAEKRITKSTLFAAMNQLDEWEYEIFYTGGDIPPLFLRAPTDT